MSTEIRLTEEQAAALTTALFDGTAAVDQTALAPLATTGQLAAVAKCKGIKLISFGKCGLYYDPPFSVRVCCEV